MENPSFLHDLTLVLLIAGLVTVLFHYLKQPVVLGYIVAGFIIGPYTPPFPLVTDPESIATLSQLGIVMLMFSLGLQLSFRGLMKVGPTASIAAILEISLMIWIGYQLGRAFGWNQMDSIFLGALLLSSSTVIIVKALNDLGLSQAPFAKFIFGILVLDDIAAVIAITVLSGIALSGELSTVELLWAGGRIGLFFTVVLVVGLLLLPRLLRFVASFKNDEVLLIVVLSLGFGTSLMAVNLGFSAALGGFLVGAVIAEAREGGRIRTLIEPVRDMFSAVFFVSIGLLLNPRMIADYWLPIAIVTIVLIVGKTLTGALGAFVAGNDTRTSLRVGLGLAQIGEFAFIIAALGRTLGVTSDFLYPIAVSVSAISTLSTPFLIKHSDNIAATLEKMAPRRVHEYLNLYSRWVASLSQSQNHTTQVRTLLRNWFLQMALNMALVTALFIAAPLLSSRALPLMRLDPKWSGLAEALLLIAALLAALPLLVATLRKLRAAAMLMAETTIRRGGTKEQIQTLRSFVTSAIVGVVGTALIVYTLVIAWMILPSWPAVLALMVAAAGVTLWQWRRFIRLYARAQGSLQQTLEAMPEPEPQQPQPMPPLLQRALIDTIAIEPDSRVVGMLIREMQLRTHTGASIVGIEREGTSVINPSPDEEIQKGDRILILGAKEQLEAAGKVLRERAPKDDSAADQSGA